MAPSSRAWQIVAASVFVHPNVTAGTTASGLNTPNVAATTVPGHLPEDAAAAREVGRAVGRGDAAELARARGEAERLVVRVALGGEVHLPGHGLEHRAELPRRLRFVDHAAHHRPPRPLATMPDPWPPTIEHATDVDDELVAAFARLIPQLSSSSPPPAASSWRTIVDVARQRAVPRPRSTGASSAA